MKAFNNETGRFLGEIKAESADSFTVLNQFGQEVQVSKSQIIFDESKAAKLSAKNHEDPHKRAMNKALSTEAYAGDAYRKAKLYFLIAFFVFSGCGGLMILFALIGFSGPPFVGWATIAGFGFMFSNGIRLLKYRHRLKNN